MSVRISVIWELYPDLGRLWRTVKTPRWLLGAVLASSMLASLMEGIGIGLLVPLVALIQDDPQTGGVAGRVLQLFPPGFHQGSRMAQVNVFCALIFAAVLAKNLLTFLGSWLHQRLSMRVGRNLRQALFSRMMRADQGIFDGTRAGELGAVFSVEAQRAQQALEFSLMLVQRLFLACMYLAFVLVLSWPLTLGLLVLVLAIGVVSLFFHGLLRMLGEEKATAHRDLFGHIGQVLAGIRILRATHAEKAALERFDSINRHVAEVERRAMTSVAAMAPFAEVMAVAGGMVLLALSHAFLIQRGLLAPAALMGFGLVLIRTLPLLNQIYGVIGHLNYAAGGVTEVLRWLQVPVFPDRPHGDRPFQGIIRSIRLEDVGYVYPNGTVALSGVTFEIPAGSTVALVGASGSGKSTLASLLLRCRRPTEGCIRVDDVDYWEFSPQTWHARLGVVEQEAFLFNDTIRNNILLGTGSLPAGRLEHAIRTAQLDEMLRSLPQGLDTLVGERGMMLSGGQRQRLAIARALARDPALLILDEATSALDNHSERRVQQALEEARQGRTSLVIAHRLSTVRSADFIVVLEKGRVAETGTWDELESRSGPFQRLLQAADSGILTNP